MLSRIILIASALVAIEAVPASAHSWYPRACCSNKDCRPADGLRTDQRGDRLVLVGGQTIWVSRFQKAMPSQDGGVHICYREVGGELDGSTNLVAICLFTPAES
jgi:hypothetical protein